MFPRSMNNKEKEVLQVVKASGLSYELRYSSHYCFSGYEVAVPELIGIYPLNDSKPFVKDFERYKLEKK
jgi:hypothetical protein